MSRFTIVFPGQKVVTTEGKVETVAYQEQGRVYVFRNGIPTAVKVCGDAWGGEHDHEVGLLAA